MVSYWVVFLLNFPYLMRVKFYALRSESWNSKGSLQFSTTASFNYKKKTGNQYSMSKHHVAPLNRVIVRAAVAWVKWRLSVSKLPAKVWKYCVRTVLSTRTKTAPDVWPDTVKTASALIRSTEREHRLARWRNVNTERSRHGWLRLCSMMCHVHDPVNCRCWLGLN